MSLRRSEGNPTVARPSYHPALDGLRAIFVLAVLLFHAGVPWAQGGFLGVSSFFTLSGFLITRLLLGEHRRSGRIDLARFWTRRFRRLMPASLLTLALIVLFGMTVGTVPQLGRLRGDVLSALAYVSNWRFMAETRSYFESFDLPSPVQHFWSLSIEEQFYLCYPLLVLVVWRRGVASVRALGVVLTALTAVGVSAGILLVAAGAPSSRLYYGTDVRAPELLVGAVLALWMASRDDDATSRLRTDAAAVAGAIVVLVGFTSMREDAGVLYGGGLLANALATAALVHAGVRPSLVGRLLAAAPLAWLGRISYGVYLYHWPVFLWLDAERTGLAALPLFALRAGVTIAMAMASYVAVERPVRLGRMLVGRRLWIGAVASVVAVGGAAVWVTHPLDATVERLRSLRMPAVADAGVPRVLVVGDSVADNLATGLREWAAVKGIPFVVWDLAESACAIGRGGERPTLRDHPVLQNHCATWPESWADAVERFDPDVVVVHTGPLDLVDRRLDGWQRALGPGDPAFDEWLLGELGAAADVLAKGGARLIWLTTPCPAAPTARVTLYETGALDPARIEYLNSVILPRLWTSQPERLRLFDLYGRACPHGHFERLIPGTRTPLRSDYLHFSKPGAAWIAESLGPIVQAGARLRRQWTVSTVTPGGTGSARSGRNASSPARYTSRKGTTHRSTSACASS